MRGAGRFRFREARIASNGTKPHGEALNAKQLRFVEEYLVDFNGTAAAIRAGYSQRTARAIAAENLTKPDIALAVKAKVATLSQEAGITANRVLQEVVRMAWLDVGQAYNTDGALKPLHDMPEDVRRAIMSVESEEQYEGEGDARKLVGYVRKVKFHDKLRGNELLGKYLKLFTEKIELSADKPLADLIVASMRKSA